MSRYNHQIRYVMLTRIRMARWDELVEKPADGQWSYFERGTHTGKTQEP